MNFFEWGEKRFARGIAKAMIRSYKLHKEFNPSLDEFELVKKTLADRPGKPANTLLTDLADLDTWESLGGNLLEITYILVRLEYAEYMGGAMEGENSKTNIVFKNTILDEFKAQII